MIDTMVRMQVHKYIQVGICFVAVTTAVIVVGVGVFMGNLIQELAGFDTPKEYIVLLQNNMELRPTGGFLGSYARVRVIKGRLELLKVEDIYTPDGQIDGHVDPPWPIQAAFGQGWYRLRDSNWDPDFSRSAETILWFFEKGNEAPAEGIIAINLHFFRDILTALGSIDIPDQEQELSADDFYLAMQSEVEEGFFPGSIQKRVYLGQVARAVFRKLEDANVTTHLSILQASLRALQEKQVVVSVHNESAQNIINRLNFAGRVERRTEYNYFSFFESNLGANKANCCVSRHVTINQEVEQDMLRQTAILDYVNTNPTTLKKPPQYYGGAYLDYLRILIPDEARDIRLQVGEVVYQEKSDAEILEYVHEASISAQFLVHDLQDSTKLAVYTVTNEYPGIATIGFFHFVDALKEQSLILSYSLPNHFYRSKLFIQKQGGVDKIEYTFDEKTNKKHYSIVSDQVVEL